MNKTAEDKVYAIQPWNDKTIVYTPYSAAFVRSIKALGDAKWNPDLRGWVVSTASTQKAVELIRHHFNQEPAMRPALTAKDVPAKKSRGFEKTERYIMRPYKKRIMIFTPYHADFVAQIKGIKGAKWDAEHKAWTVSAGKSREAADIIQRVFGKAPELESEIVARLDFSKDTIYPRYGIFVDEWHLVSVCADKLKISERVSTFRSGSVKLNEGGTVAVKAGAVLDVHGLTTSQRRIMISIVNNSKEAAEHGMTAYEFEIPFPGLM